MSLTRESIKKLRAVKAAILDEPELYNQGEFPKMYRGDTCNTPCCIAGWAVWIANPNKKDYQRKLAECQSFGSFEMAEALGIDRDQASRLFCEWPDCESPAWLIPGTKEAAIDGAKRIERFIRSGGAQ